MNDQISRQKLIAEIEELIEYSECWYDTSYHDGYIAAMECIKHRVKSQPPAVGIDKQKLIQDVEYLISHTPEDSKEHYAYKICKELIDSQPPADQWIPCSTLPTEEDYSKDGYVLVQEADTNIIYKGWYENIEGGIHWYDEMGFSMEAAMWHRLPEPYKGVE